jgi:ubiquinone/menaquinone biosynthesis C-methylase UbiE
MAVDPSESQIARARTKITPAKAAFRLADAQDLPFPDHSFDVVASALVVNFISNRASAMSEMCRVVRPGGLIAACVWNFARFEMICNHSVMASDIPRGIAIKGCCLN